MRGALCCKATRGVCHVPVCHHTPIYIHSSGISLTGYALNIALFSPVASLTHSLHKLIWAACQRRLDIGDWWFLVRIAGISVCFFMSIPVVYAADYHSCIMSQLLSLICDKNSKNITSKHSKPTFSSFECCLKVPWLCIYVYLLWIR